MEVMPEIWLSSVTSAVFFFSGGRLWQKAASLHRTINPWIRGDRPAPRESGEQSAALDDAGAEIRRLWELAEQRDLEAIELRSQIERLRREVERLSAEAAEAEALRRRVRELETTGFASVDVSFPPTPTPGRTASNPKLESAITIQLDALRAHDGSWRTAVLSDLRGLLVASSGDLRHDAVLGAAASLTSDTTSRLQQLLPMDEPVEIRLVDARNTVFTVRWIRGDHDSLLLATLGVGAPRPDPRADAIRASISNLLRWT